MSFVRRGIGKNNAVAGSIAVNSSKPDAKPMKMLFTAHLKDLRTSRRVAL
jgi:hypothetical protein